MTGLPSGWGEATLGDVADVLDARRIPVNAKERAKRPGTIPYYGATGQVGWIDKALFNEELLLLGEDGAPFLDPRRQKAYLINGPSWVNNHAHVLRARDVTSNRFLKYALDATDYGPHVRGTTRMKLTQKDMRAISLPIPPLAEQQRIVAAIEEQFTRLDAADGLMDSARARAFALQKAALNELASETWRSRGESSATVGELKRFSFYGPRFSSGVYGLEGPYVVRTSDISRWGTLDVSNAPRIPLDDATYAKYKVERGDLLVTRTGSIGTLAIYDDDAPAIPGAYLIQFRLDPDRVDSWFAFYCLESPRCQAQLLSGAAGVGRPNLNARAVDQIRIPLPPMQIQRQIVARIRELLSVVERLTDDASRVRTRIQSLRTSILNSAFSGTLMSGVGPRGPQGSARQAT